MPLGLMLTLAAVVAAVVAVVPVLRRASVAKHLVVELCW